jgi:ATP-dependent RNA helicase DeaD
MTDNFQDLGLSDALLKAVTDSGYETPSPIQAQAIPVLLQGRDVIGQAQTGTGKTAAFALPMIELMDTSAPGIQALVMTPTRELAAQVSNNIHRYGKSRNVRVMPIYGGQSYTRQFKRLENAPQVIIGTPGRVVDLLNQGAITFATVRYLVLDEADEMLKMGFMEDMEAILRAVPEDRQTAMFSATMPREIRSLAEQYMRDPVVITVQHQQMTVPQVEQRHYLVYDDDKLAALSRLLETEPITSALIFTRTRAGSAELAEALLERGFIADALHGELNQAAREAVLRRFRSGSLPLLVATDVVARGVDISGVSHVINFDMPHNPEDYVHRIGRTGRAGRSGIAITLITPRERRWLADLERFIRVTIPRAELPTLAEVRSVRDRRFFERLGEALVAQDFDAEMTLLNEYVGEGIEPAYVAAAAMRLARADENRRPIEHIKTVRDDPRRSQGRRDVGFAGRDGGRNGYRSNGSNGSSYADRGPRGRSRTAAPEAGMVTLLMNVGHDHGIRPGDVVGAIAAEAGIPGKAIGAIDIRQDRTYVDVNEAHVDKVLSRMQQGRRLRGVPVNLTRA